MRLDRKNHERDKYSSLLSIEGAVMYDTGTYTCQIKDWQTQQCKSIGVSVIQPVRVGVKPLYKTVNRVSTILIIIIITIILQTLANSIFSCMTENKQNNSTCTRLLINSGSIELIKRNNHKLLYEKMKRINDLPPVTR